MTEFAQTPPPGGALLSDAERHRFAGWLEFESVNAAAMAELMAKQGMPEVLVKKERGWAAVTKLVALRLRSTESMSIGPGAAP